MHDVSYNAMQDAVSRYMDTSCRYIIIDVGSYEYTGSYRPIFDVPGWHYVGADQRRGPNVDVLWDEDLIDNLANLFDVVISGQTVEHVEQPWVFIRQLNRVCVMGGLLILIAPWRAPVHKAPLDCWRMLPDGAAALLKWGGFEVLETRLLREGRPPFDDSSHGSTSWGDDTVAIGRKNEIFWDDH